MTSSWYIQQFEHGHDQWMKLNLFLTYLWEIISEQSQDADESYGEQNGQAHQCLVQARTVREQSGGIWGWAWHCVTCVLGVLCVVWVVCWASLCVLAKKVRNSDWENKYQHIYCGGPTHNKAFHNDIIWREKLYNQKNKRVLLCGIKTLFFQPNISKKVQSHALTQTIAVNLLVFFYLYP